MPIKLLIIDDEETIVFAVNRYFQSAGYEVDSARELEEAEALLTSSRYDVVLADLALGDGSGTEGLELVRYARRRNPCAVIVMMTGYGSREVESEAVRRGIDAFVNKPVELAQLEEIRRTVRRRTAISTSDRFSEILQPGGIHIMFQPIVKFSSEGETLCALEALSRGPRGTNMENAEVLFAYARRKDREVILDRFCIANALQAAALFPGHPTISLNVHPATLTTTPNFRDWLESGSTSVGIHPSRLIVEIIEHQGASSRTEMMAALSQLRSAGVGIAVDDIGIGDANCGMLIDCHPEYLKVDRYVVQGCTSDPYRRAILRAIVAVAQSTDSVVVAEGVECYEDMATLLDLGIDIMQGFLISRPITTEDLLNSRFLPSAAVHGISDCDAVAGG